MTAHGIGGREDARTGGRAFQGPAGSRETSRQQPIPDATVARLAVCLRVLTDLIGTDRTATVSSAELSRLAGVDAATMRRDLSFVGSYGVRGVGYHAEVLADEIARVLGTHRSYPTALAGVGNLGAALAGYAGFGGRGFPFTALFDTDPRRVGTVIGGVAVSDASTITPVCSARGITIGVIATPDVAAQQVADAMVAAGVRSILNFAPRVIAVPAGVRVRQIDLALELQILAFHETRRHETLHDQTQHDETQHDETLHDETQHDETQHDETQQDETQRSALADGQVVG